jgi:hypothetical protein
MQKESNESSSLLLLELVLSVASLVIFISAWQLESPAGYLFAVVLGVLSFQITRVRRRLERNVAKRHVRSRNMLALQSRDN